MSSRSKLLTCSVFLLLLLQVTTTLVSAVDEEAVNLELADAEEALVSAYDAVLEAEESGANVSSLLVRLNVGGGYLTEAYVWYRLGALEDASSLAVLSSEIVGDVESEAVELRDEVERLGEAGFVAKIYSSAIGVVVVVVLGFVVWRVFRNRYNRKLLALRPEVVSDES